MAKVQVYISSDHAGFELKKILSQFLLEEEYVVTDVGPDIFDPTDDYTDFSFATAKKVAEDPTGRKGIIIGGSGQGEAIAANRIKGIRAAIFYGYPENKKEELDIVKLSREHNDANILSLGARFITPDEAKIVIKKWLTTDFSGEERHVRRIKELDEYNG